MATGTAANTDRGTGGQVTGNEMNVNSSSGQPTSPVADWSGEAVPLKDFASKCRVPGLARVVKGSYMTIGASKFSFHKQHQDVYVHSVKMGVKVLAHCMRRVEMPGGSLGGGGGHHYYLQHLKGGGGGPRASSVSLHHLPSFRLVPMDQRLTVPITYQGWFELLSEDGKAARPISGVPELAKTFPQRCLVRENVKAYLSPSNNSNNEGGANRLASSSSLTFDKTKILPAGEQLKLVGEVSLPAPSEGARVKLLRCVDSKGDHVFLSFDQKGLFTPIAEEGDFTGVFSILDIVRRFRLPLTVKLAHGVKPRVSESKFSGLLRLEWVYSEDTAFVCPLEKNHVRLLPVPCDVSLQMVAATNQEEIASTETFRSLQAKCSRMVANYNNTLHLLVSVPEAVVKTQTKNTRASNVFSAPLDSPSTQPPNIRRSKSKEDILMEEIDDLYGYVREGGVPPKSKFQYDSDEESYWEEPAYEPLDQFRARLKALESGQQVTYPPHYRPADPNQLKAVAGGAPPGVTAHPIEGPDTDQPPPLPPRQGDLHPHAAGAAPVERSASSVTHRYTGSSHPRTRNEAVLRSASTAAHLVPHSHHQSHHHHQGLQLSAGRPTSSTVQLQQPPPPQPSSQDSSGGGGERKGASDPAALEKYTPTTTVTAAPTTVAVPETSPPRRVTRSGSEPALVVHSRIASAHQIQPRVSPAATAVAAAAEDPFPASSAQARPSPKHRRQPQQQSVNGGGGARESEAAVRLDWKERLRRFNDLEGKDKDQGSSSTSSGSEPRTAAQRLARDFKDSDLSSRPKGSSSGNSSGDKGVKKRMQILYL